MKKHFALIVLFFLGAAFVRADEQLWGFVRGAETLPAHRSELYQFYTFREGKPEGTYYGSDFESEYEYGFTDKFQASLSLVQHYFYNQGVDGDRDALDDHNNYRFGGVEGSAKYRLLSPFKDPIGLALRLEGGYLLNDEVDGLKQHERYVKPEIDLQKDFLTIRSSAHSISVSNGRGVNNRPNNIRAKSHSKALRASPTVSHRTGMPALKFTHAGNIRSSILTNSSIAFFTQARASITRKRIGGRR